jgi:hypothetical protein
VFYAWLLCVKLGLAAGYFSEVARMMYVAGVLSSLAAFVTLRKAGDYIDFPVKESWQALLQRLGEGVGELKLEKPLTLDVLVFQVALSVIAGMIAIGLLHPTFRDARARLIINSPRYWENATQNDLKGWSAKQIKRGVSKANLLLPLCAIVLWVNPLTKDVVLNGSRITAEVFDGFRLFVVLGLCALRISTFRTHAQAFLQPPPIGGATPDKAGARDIQQQLASTVIALPAYSIMYLAPVVGCGLVTFLLKQKTNICWGLCTVVFGEATAGSAEEMEIARSLTLAQTTATALAFALWWTHILTFVFSVFWDLYYSFEQKQQQARARKIQTKQN